MTPSRRTQDVPGSGTGTSPESRPFESRSPPDYADRLAIIRLEFEIPHGVWLSRFTRKHPDLLVEVHNTMTVDPKQTLGDFEIYGPPTDWTREIAECPDVLRVERLDVFPDLGRYRVLFRQPIYLTIAHELAVLLSYPRITQGGIFTCETIAPTSQVRCLVAALRDSGCKARVVSLRRDSLRSCRPVFTPVQRDLFRQALASGYFEVPRRISLSGLAKKLSRSKSSVSETLAVVERKLAETAASAAM
jgi:predicted DNA binding protein